MHPPTSPAANWQPPFLRLLNNRQQLDSGKERHEGFVAVVTGKSLAPVESVCAGQRYNHCVTARYRIKESAVVGSVLDQLANDLTRVAAAEATVGTFVWPESLDPPALARSARDAGVERRENLTAADATFLIERLGTVVTVGYRLVVLAELEQPPDSVEWRLACATLFRSLPERVGLVFGCDEERLRLPAGPQFLEIAESLEAGEPGVTGLDNDVPQVDDALGIDPHHLTLAKFLLHERTGPLTMAIEAPWGRGKSSFMSFLENDLVALTFSRPAVTVLHELRLRRARQREPQESVRTLRERAVQDELVVLHFSAWRYKHAEQLWAGLAHQVFHDLRKRLPWRSRLVLPLAYGWRHRGRDLVTLTALLLLAVALALAALLLGVSGDSEVAGGVLGVGSMIAIGALVVRSANLARPAVDWLANYARMPDYASSRGRQHEVIDDLDFICGAVRRRRPSCRMMLFVDDLDRCSDEHIVELLSAVHLVLGASDFYVILGVDTRMVYRAIATVTSTPAGGAPGEEEDIPGDYLRKIVQVSYRLPRLGPAERFRIVKSMFSAKSQRLFEQTEHARGVGGSVPADDDGLPRAEPAAPVEAGEPVEGVFAVRPEIVVRPPAERPDPLEDTPVELEAYRDFAPLLPENPRQLKRLVNAHRTVKLMFDARSAYWQREDQRTLVLWLCACMRWPLALGAALDPASRPADLRGWGELDGDDLMRWLEKPGRLPAREQQMLKGLRRDPDDRLLGLDADTRSLMDKLVRCGLLEDQLPGLGTSRVIRRAVVPVGNGGAATPDQQATA